MYSHDQTEGFFPSENAPRRKSSSSKSIWSTKSDFDHPQFSIDLANFNASRSPVKPPSTPLLQVSQFDDTIPGTALYGSKTDESLYTGYNVQHPGPNPAGLGMSTMNGQRDGYQTSFGEISQNFQSIQDMQTLQNAKTLQNIQNQRHSISSLDQRQKHYFQDTIGSPTFYLGPQYSSPSTPNFASQTYSQVINQNCSQIPSQNPSQNVLQNLSQNSHSQLQDYSVISPCTEYTGLSQESYRRADTQNSFSGASTSFNPYNPNISSGYGNNGISITDAELALSPTNSYSRMPTEYHSSTVPSTSFQMRRHSSGPGSIIPDEYLDNNLVAKVDDYFTRDPCKKIRVTGPLIQKCSEMERALLSPRYGLPDFSPDEYSMKATLVLVAFKAGRLDVFYVPRGSGEVPNLQEGTFVIVEADRGHNLGKVYAAEVSWEEARVLRLLDTLQQNVNFGDKYTKDLQLNQLSQLDTRAGNSKHNVLASPKAVIRLASPSEVSLILRKSQDEDNATCTSLDKIINTIIVNKNSHKRPDNPKAVVSSNPEELRNVQFVDFEYQFDRKKLTVDYTAPRRVDFRDVVRELYSIFKTRIWMSLVVSTAVNTNRPQTERRSNQPIRGNTMKGKSGNSRLRIHPRGSGSPPTHSCNSAGIDASELSQQDLVNYCQNSSVPKKRDMRSFRKNTFVPADDCSGSISNDANLSNTICDANVNNSQAFIPRRLRDTSNVANVDNNDTELDRVSKSLVENLNL